MVRLRVHLFGAEVLNVELRRTRPQPPAPPPEPEAGSPGTVAGQFEQAPVDIKQDPYEFGFGRSEEIR